MHAKQNSEKIKKKCEKLEIEDEHLKQFINYNHFFVL